MHGAVHTIPILRPAIITLITAILTIAANDGTNQNIYQWFAEQQNAILPVELKEFTARLLKQEG